MNQLPNASLPHFRHGELNHQKLKSALRSVELQVRRKLDGLLKGNYLGLIPGPGSEPGEVRGYVPGDDVRRIDWSVSARTQQTHVRQTIVDRELEVWMVVDLSTSVDFGSLAVFKRDLIVAATAMIIYLAQGHGNRVGAVIGNGHSIVRVPPRSSTAHVRSLLQQVATFPSFSPETEAEGSLWQQLKVGKKKTPPTFAVPGHDLKTLLDQIRKPRPPRGLVVVISDFLGEVNWEKSLRTLATSSDILGIEVIDPRDVSLPDVGEVVLQDMESGQLHEFMITHEVRDRFAAHAAQHRETVHRAFRSVRAPMLTLRTDREWTTDILKFVTRYRRGLKAG